MEWAAPPALSCVALVPYPEDMRIILVRHGETAWNAEGRLQGHLDIPLAESGQQQAVCLASRLADQPITRAVASTLSRARQTAEIALGPRAGLVTFDPGLRELNHGAWEGLKIPEVAERFAESSRAWRETPHLARPDGGETLQEVLDRAWPALVRGCEGLGAEDTLLVVTHDIVVRVILARVLGLPHAQVWRFRLAPTSVSLLEGPGPDALSILRVNDASHLYPLFGEAVHRRL